MLATKITIICPDRFEASRVCACLDDAGYRASTATLADDTLEILRRQPPDLLLLDGRLSDCDMLAFLRRIRRESSLSRLPIILMGGELREEDAMQALEAGADQCWREPFNPRLLVARVRAYLRPRANG